MGHSSFLILPSPCFPSVVWLGVTHHPHTSWLQIYCFPFPRVLWLAWVVLLLLPPGHPHGSTLAGGAGGLDGVRELHPCGREWVLTRWGASVVLLGAPASSRLTWFPHTADSGQCSKAVEAGAIRACEAYVLEVTLQYLHYFLTTSKSRGRPSIKGGRN